MCNGSSGGNPRPDESTIIVVMVALELDHHNIANMIMGVMLMLIFYGTY